MKLRRNIENVKKILILITTLYCLLQVDSVQSLEKFEDNDDKPFVKYTQEMLVKYNYKDYLAAIFENEETRQDFAKFVNKHLTQEIKEDFKAIRVFKKVDNVEMPLIAFNGSMDTWLGILPQWKRIKKFLFGEMISYVDLHPSILDKVRIYRPHRGN